MHACMYDDKVMICILNGNASNRWKSDDIPNFLGMILGAVHY